MSDVGVTEVGGLGDASEWPGADRDHVLSPHEPVAGSRVPPVPPEDLDVLIRSRLRMRRFELFVPVVLMTLVLGAWGLGSLLADDEMLGVVLLFVAAAAPALLVRVTSRRYGRRGSNWRSEVLDELVHDHEWREVEVWFATSVTKYKHAERVVLLVESGEKGPRVAVIAPRGTGLGLPAGRGWVWGHTAVGKASIVHVGGRTLWCVGPAHGRVFIAGILLTTWISKVLPTYVLHRPSAAQA